MGLARDCPLLARAKKHRDRFAAAQLGDEPGPAIARFEQGVDEHLHKLTLLTKEVVAHRGKAERPTAVFGCGAGEGAAEVAQAGRHDLAKEPLLAAEVVPDQALLDRGVCRDLARARPLEAAPGEKPSARAQER